MHDQAYPTDNPPAERHGKIHVLWRPAWLAWTFYRSGIVSKIGVHATGAYICAAFDCLRNDTGGFIPEAAWTPDEAAALVQAGLWLPVDGGYWMPEDGPLRLERPDDDQGFEAVMPIFGDY